MRHAAACVALFLACASCGEAAQVTADAPGPRTSTNGPQPSVTSAPFRPVEHPELQANDDDGDSALGGVHAFSPRYIEKHAAGVVVGWLVAERETRVIEEPGHDQRRIGRELDVEVQQEIAGHVADGGAVTLSDMWGWAQEGHGPRLELNPGGARLRLGDRALVVLTPNPNGPEGGRYTLLTHDSFILLGDAGPIPTYRNEAFASSLEQMTEEEIIRTFRDLCGDDGCNATKLVPP